MPLLKLMRPAGIKAPYGALAEEKPHGTYPDLYYALPWHSRDEFVCVDWVTETVQPNGYYLLARFESCNPNGEEN